MLFGDAHQARKNLDASSDESKAQLCQIYVALSRKREPISFDPSERFAGLR